MNGKMRKSGFVFGAVAIALLMVSSATAVEPASSGPVMNNIESEKQKEIIMDQLETMWNQLLEEESLVAEIQENFAIDPSQDFEDLFDSEGFVNYLISDEFINLLNNNYNDIVSNVGFQYLTDTEYVQEYLQSDEFIAFMNTDEVQYIIDNLNIGSGNPNGQVVSPEVEQQASEELMYEPLTNEQIYNDNADEEFQGSETPLCNAQPTIDLALAWIIILIGIITWIPGVILVLLLSPVFSLAVFINFLLYSLQYYMPGSVILCAMIALVATIAFVIIGCICWPVVWPELFAFFLWGAAL